MEQAKRILPRLFQQAQGPRMPDLDLIRAFWPETVGAKLAEHSYPTGLKAQRLSVEVWPAAWMEEFVPMERQILSLLNQELPDSRVRRIEFAARRDAAGRPSPTPDADERGPAR